MIDTLKTTLDELQVALVGLALDEELLRKVRRAIRLVPELEKIWRCFHCGFEATKEEDARAHFGNDQRETPLCFSWVALNADGRAALIQSVVTELNEMRRENRQLQVENEGLEYRVGSHDIQIATRFKGARSINDAWNQLDSMEGRALAAEERAVAAEARLTDLHSLRPLAEYHEDYGTVLWYHYPIQEPPLVGAGPGMCERNADGTATLCRQGIERGYLTHWSPLPRNPELAAVVSAEVVSA